MQDFKDKFNPRNFMSIKNKEEPSLYSCPIDGTVFQGQVCPTCGHDPFYGLYEGQYL